MCFPSTVYLPAAKIVPLADPKVEMATERGMIQAKIPSMRLPKV